MLDLEHLRGWIGREEQRSEVLTAAHAERFQATLGLPGGPPAMGEAAPRLIHFTLCQPVAPASELGEDGHPRRGGFLPPVPLPRRMWAGSALTFTGEVRVGDTVTRRSTVVDVAVKSGRSGALCFVTVDHRIEAGGTLAVQDRQFIVYRDASAAVPGPPETAPVAVLTETVDVTPTLLFRYSALTFNGHRIHYDQAYATGVEGYRGLVVHGPLQATLLYHFAARAAGTPDRFDFRSKGTLFAGEPMCLHAGCRTSDSMELWTAAPDGAIAMSAQAAWNSAD